MNFFHLRHDSLPIENTAEGYTVGMPKHVALIDESDEGGEFLDEGLWMNEQPLTGKEGCENDA
jgi:hypothetical protein